MPVVNDIDRPDVGGVLAKMHGICEQTKIALDGMTPFLRIFTDDNLMSSVTVRGAFEPKEEWSYGIFENATSFMFHISPDGGKRYYTEGEKVTVELISSKWTLPKFRKYTGPIDKVLAKIKEWHGKKV